MAKQRSKKMIISRRDYDKLLGELRKLLQAGRVRAEAAVAQEMVST